MSMTTRRAKLPYPPRHARRVDPLQLRLLAERDAEQTRELLAWAASQLARVEYARAEFRVKYSAGLGGWVVYRGSELVNGAFRHRAVADAAALRMSRAVAS